MNSYLKAVRFWTFGGWFTWVAVAIGGSALIGAGTSIYEGNQAQKAISQQQALLNNLQYTPIDIASLQKTATQTSINDAVNSLALQRQLQPNVVASNTALQQSVAKQLAEGGNLPPDIENQVAQAARSQSSTTGTTGNAAPITAALLGSNALSLLQSRQAAAEQLSASNPAPAVGLSAQDIASASEANSNALNQFNIAKAGGSASLIGSTAQNNAATAAGVGSSASQALGLLALLKGGTGSSTLSPGASAAISAAPNQQGLGGIQSTNASTVGGFI